MASEKQKKKQRHKKAKEMKTKMLLVPDNEGVPEDESGMFLEEEDVKLIHKALSAYKPTEDEEYLHSVLLEQFEEILVVDYNEPYAGGN
jgi:hypothetical protein